MVQIDISLPHSCDDCPFGYEDYKTNVPGCDLMEDLPNCPEYDIYTPIGQRDKNCPLREVPKGKWITDKYGNVICSACECYAPKVRYPKTNFCGHCGADMRE